MVGYLYHLAFLFLGTGIFILRFDKMIYQMARMKKEKKVAQCLGWINLLLGGATFVFSWAYQKWFW